MYYSLDSSNQLKERLELALSSAPEILSERAVSEVFEGHIPEETLRLYRHLRVHNKPGNHGPRFLKFGRRIAYLKQDLIDWIITQNVSQKNEEERASIAA